MAHTDPFTVEEHMIFKDSGEDIISSMPVEFATVQDAQFCRSVISRRIIHFSCLFWDGIRNLASQKQSYPSLDEGVAIEQQRIFKYHGKYMGELGQWMAAFNPLYHKIQMSGQDRELQAATALRVQFLASYVSLTHLMDSEELAYDDSYHIFTEIVTLAKLLLEKNDAVYTFDLQGLWALDIVAKKCRDPSIRREAIWLLEYKPRREGIWDSIIAAKICRWIVEIEEEGMVAGFIPEDSRARDIEVKLDLQKWQAQVSCQLPAKDFSGTMRQKEAVISW